jgi:hypothetical protein
MRAIVILAISLLTLNTHASGEGFCSAKAKEWQQFLHQKVLEEVGVIQGYSEDTSYKLSTIRHAMDNATETYNFFVDAQNDENDTWTWGYKVVIEAWLGADGKPWLCSVLKANYKGVLESQEN